MVKPDSLEAALVQHAPEAIVFADCEGIIRVWNGGAEALFGHTAEEAVGKSLDLIVPESFRAAHWAGFSRAVRRGRFAKDGMLQTSRALVKDGSTILVELSAAIIRNESGEVWGIMAIGRNVAGRPARNER
jgi:PAS domain S-box-containing protein